MAEAGALDPERAVTEREGTVLIPIRDPPTAREAVEAPIVEARLPPNPRRPPIDRIRERLRGTLPGPLVGALPERWTKLGDVVLLRPPEVLDDHAEEVAQAYGEVLGADTVLALEATRGPLREPVTRHLWGDEDTETVHREHGIVYHLDPQRVLFSAGNHHERHRLTDRVEPGEHVVDLFAGVGYFTLPLAAAGARVTACELNPVSAGYLRRNVEANGLAGQVEVREGDCRDVAPEDAADRVLMGYLPRTRRFVPCALRALRPEGGVVHYHTEVDAEAAEREAWQEFTSHPDLAAAKPRLLSSRHVKSVGPGRAHVVLDVGVRP